jgi:Na+/glutamate symporter
MYFFSLEFSMEAVYEIQAHQVPQPVLEQVLLALLVVLALLQLALLALLQLALALLALLQLDLALIALL